MKLVLDVRKSVEGNAAVYFEKAKKARKKLEGAKAALEKTQQKLQQLIFRKETADKMFAAEAEEKKTAAARSQQKEWFEKFRWFVSSEGFLCIGGRDATTNEIIIKKHAEKDDIVFHTELAGSPFFVVKRNSNASATAVREETIKEAAAATAGYSRAWKAGLQSVDVYWVKPGQVSKEAKAGEYLVKGAFMIYGKKNYVPATIGLAVGITAAGKIMGGPAAAVSKNCVKSVKILQGDDKPSDAAKKIAKLLGLSSNKGTAAPSMSPAGDKLRLSGEVSTLGKSYLDEIIRAMPAGEFKVVV